MKDLYNKVNIFTLPVDSMLILENIFWWNSMMKKQDPSYSSTQGPCKFFLVFETDSLSQGRQALIQVQPRGFTYQQKSSLGVSTYWKLTGTCVLINLKKINAFGDHFVFVKMDSLPVENLSYQVSWSELWGRKRFYGHQKILSCACC